MLLEDLKNNNFYSKLFTKSLENVMSLQHCVTYILRLLCTKFVIYLVGHLIELHIVAEWIKPLNHYESSISLLQTS